MKKIVLSIVAFATVSLVVSCVSEEQETSFGLGEKKLSLKSEKGYVLASNSEVCLVPCQLLSKKNTSKRIFKKI